MNKREGVIFLFTIAKEIQHSFENPVILFTHRDYADGIFKSLVDIRQALLENVAPDKVAEIVNSFHLKWLEAVQEVEKFKKRLKETPRDLILKAIDFTIQCTVDRYTYLKKYIDRMRYTMTEEENELIQADLTIVREMQDIVNSALLEKQKYIRSQADQTEYHLKIQDEVEELMTWLDRIYDSLAIQFCKVLNLKIPVAPTDLTKTLQQVVDEVAADPNPEAQRVAELIHIKGKLLGSAIRISSLNELEIAKIVEKIRSLEERIGKLQNQNSSALMALKHKAMFLEERLQSLENIKASMNILRNESATNEEDNLNEHKDVRIFNHLLPHHDRCRLVEQLVQLWNSAIIDHDHESIISILSVADLKEVFSDDKGNFCVDKYGRKIYTKADDNIYYQLNQNNELVPLRDEEKRVFFYDACGRYYINDVRERVYKDHEGASEYILTQCGYLVKVLEQIDGTDYYYDWLGRYHINDKGEHIYCEENSTVEYEHDGLGNLVKIHTDTFYYEPCPPEPMTTEENKYLKRVVGEALKICISDVVYHQPNDPVGYLADRLTKYNDNILAHQKHLIEEQERFEECELFQTAKENTPNRAYTEDESYDSNFIDYKHGIDDNVDF